MGPRSLRRIRAEPARLRVDPVACDGIGMCAHVAPELIGLDPWGFPLIPGEPLSGGEQRAARRAVGGCPRRALFLEVQAGLRPPEA